MFKSILSIIRYVDSGVMVTRVLSRDIWLGEGEANLVHLHTESFSDG